MGGGTAYTWATPYSPVWPPSPGWVVLSCEFPFASVLLATSKTACLYAYVCVCDVMINLPNSALFIVSLAMHSVAVHRHRAAGLHCKAGGSPAQAHAAGGFGDIPNQHNAIPMGGPVPQEKQHPAPTYSAVAPDQHQHHQQQPYQQPQPQQPQPQQPQQPQQQYVGVSPSPPSAGMYQPPTSSLASPQPFYPPQGQQVSPVGGQFGGGPVPAPHPGSYEAQGQPVGYQQH